jgi:cell wall-associated NlpC family hydrolase
MLKKLLVTLMIACTASLVALSSTAHAGKAEDTKRHLTKRAKSELGTKYRYGGGSPRGGFDCSGFTRWTFKTITTLPHSSMLQYKLGKRASYKRVHKRARLKRGDLVFFKTTSAKVGHVGMYLDKGRFVHASSGAGKVTISSVYDKYFYGPRFRGGIRIPRLRG